MEEIIYSDNFYVNEFPDKGVDYAKGFIETFMKKPPKKLVDYLNEQNHFGKVSPEFQAVIMGEPRGSLFGKAQAAVLLVHSNFIAYTTTSDYTTPMGINYGYATFDNQLSVFEENNALEVQIPYEAFRVGVGSISQKEDLKVLERLLEKNRRSIELFYEVSQGGSADKTETVTPVATPLPSEPLKETTIEAEKVDDMPEETEEEWGHILMEENRQGEMEEMKHLPAERKDQYPAEQAQSRREQPVEPTPEPQGEMKTEEPVMDRRFEAEGPIISHNSIPKGFVYHEPVVYVNSVRPGFFKSSTARGAYTKAYQACLDEIKEDIETGKFDAVFNLTYSAQSVENYFDVMVTGDAVVFE